MLAPGSFRAQFKQLPLRGKILAAAAVGGTTAGVVTGARMAWREHQKTYEHVRVSPKRQVSSANALSSWIPVPPPPFPISHYKPGNQTRVPLLEKYEPWKPTHEQNDIMLMFITQARK